MDKIITVTTSLDLVPRDSSFVETEYPEIKKYLEDGYEVKQIIPILKTTEDPHRRFAIVFHLHKFQR
jgi:hypothetical protein